MSLKFSGRAGVMVALTKKKQNKKLVHLHMSFYPSALDGKFV